MSLYRGSEGDAVEQVQKVLRRAGAYTGKVDAWFGPKTEQAVKDWQTFVSAKTDGVFGPDTARRTINLISALNPDMSVDNPIIPGVPDGSL